MNNVKLKNVIQKLNTDSNMPFAGIDTLNHGDFCKGLNAADMTNSFNQLQENDLYIQAYLNDMSENQPGPDIGTYNKAAAKQNGYKYYGDVDNADCLPIMRKVDHPLSSTWRRSSILTGDIDFTLKYGDTVMAASDGALYYLNNISSDEWVEIDGIEYAECGYTDGDRIFIGCDDGVYSISRTMNISGEYTFVATQLNANVEDVKSIAYDTSSKYIYIVCGDSAKTVMYAYVSADKMSFHELEFIDADISRSEDLTINSVNAMNGQVIVCTNWGIFRLGVYENLAGKNTYGFSGTVDSLLKSGDYLYLATSEGLFRGTDLADMTEICEDVSDVKHLAQLDGNIYFSSGSELYCLEGGINLRRVDTLFQNMEIDSDIDQIVADGFSGFIFICFGGKCAYFKDNFSEQLYLSQFQVENAKSTACFSGGIAISTSNGVYIFRYTQAIDIKSDMIDSLSSILSVFNENIIDGIQISDEIYIISDNHIYRLSDRQSIMYFGRGITASAKITYEGSECLALCDGTGKLRIYDMSSNTLIASFESGLVEFISETENCLIFGKSGDSSKYIQKQDITLNPDKIVQLDIDYSEGFSYGEDAILQKTGTVDQYRDMPLPEYVDTQISAGKIIQCEQIRLYAALQDGGLSVYSEENKLKKRGDCSEDFIYTMLSADVGKVADAVGFIADSDAYRFAFSNSSTLCIAKFTDDDLSDDSTSEDLLGTVTSNMSCVVFPDTIDYIFQDGNSIYVGVGNSLSVEVQTIQQSVFSAGVSCVEFGQADPANGLIYCANNKTMLYSDGKTTQLSAMSADVRIWLNGFNLLRRSSDLIYCLKDGRPYLLSSYDDASNPDISYLSVIGLDSDEITAISDIKISNGKVIYIEPDKVLLKNDSDLSAVEIFADQNVKAADIYYDGEYPTIACISETDDSTGILSVAIYINDEVNIIFKGEIPFYDGSHFKSLYMLGQTRAAILDSQDGLYTVNLDDASKYSLSADVVDIFKRYTDDGTILTHVEDRIFNNSTGRINAVGIGDDEIDQFVFSGNNVCIRRGNQIWLGEDVKTFIPATVYAGTTQLYPSNGVYGQTLYIFQVGRKLYAGQCNVQDSLSTVQILEDMPSSDEAVVQLFYSGNNTEKPYILEVCFNGNVYQFEFRSVDDLVGLKFDNPDYSGDISYPLHFSEGLIVANGYPYIASDGSIQQFNGAVQLEKLAVPEGELEHASYVFKSGEELGYVDGTDIIVGVQTIPLKDFDSFERIRYAGHAFVYSSDQQYYYDSDIDSYRQFEYGEITNAFELDENPYVTVGDCLYLTKNAKMTKLDFGNPDKYTINNIEQLATDGYKQLYIAYGSNKYLKLKKYDADSSEMTDEQALYNGDAVQLLSAVFIDGVCQSNSFYSIYGKDPLYFGAYSDLTEWSNINSSFIDNVKHAYLINGKYYLAYADKIISFSGYRSMQGFILNDDSFDSVCLESKSINSGYAAIKTETDAGFGVARYDVDDDEYYVISEDSGINAICPGSDSNTSSIIYAISGNGILESSGLKLWKKTCDIGCISGEVYPEFNSLQMINSKSFVAGSDMGIYYSRYMYDVVQDVSAFTQQDAVELYNDVMSAENGISTVASAAMSSHIESAHSADQTIQQVNDIYLGIDMSGISGWQENNKVLSNLLVRNDIVDQIEFGSQADNKIKVHVENYLISCDVDFTYIVKRWMSGIMEIFINVPTTYTYYLADTVGAADSAAVASDMPDRPNIYEFGDRAKNVTGTVNDHYTTVTVKIPQNQYDFDCLLGTHINGNSLPLGIYKTSSTVDSDSYKSFVEPSLFMYTPSETDVYGNWLFNFACFGSDAQAIKLMFYGDSLYDEQFIIVRFNSDGYDSYIQKFKLVDGVIQQAQLLPVAFSQDSGTVDSWQLNLGSRSGCGSQFNPRREYATDAIWPAYSSKAKQLSELGYQSGSEFKSGDIIDLYAVWQDTSLFNMNTFVLANVYGSLVNINKVELKDGHTTTVTGISLEDE